MPRRKGTMYDKTIESKFLKETITLTIYEPETIDMLYPYHLCFMPDGNDYYPLGRVATISDKLHDSEEIINTILIGIPYVNRMDRYHKYYPDGENFAAYKRFIVEEVLPLVEGQLPFHPLPPIRTMMGDSLAGTVSCIIATEHPDLFQQIVMQSPLIDDKVLNLIEKKDNFYPFQIYHSIGLAETEVLTANNGVVDFVTPNQRLSQALKNCCSNYTYREIEAGDHTWKYWQKEMPTIFEKMFI